MKAVSGEDSSAGADGLVLAILDGVPRTAWIDGIDLLREVRSALRCKAEKANEAAHAAFPQGIDDEKLSDVFLSRKQHDLASRMSYDELIWILNELVKKKRILKKVQKEGDAPIFQRID